MQQRHQSSSFDINSCANFTKMRNKANGKEKNKYEQKWGKRKMNNDKSQSVLKFVHLHVELIYLVQSRFSIQIHEKATEEGEKKYGKLDRCICIYIHILGALSIFAQPNKLQTREWVWDSYLLHLIWHCSCSAHIQFHRRLFSHQTKWQTKAIQSKPQPLLVLCASVSLCYSVLSNEQAKR